MFFLCRRSPAVAFVYCASASRTRYEGLLASYNHGPVPERRKQPAERRGFDATNRRKFGRRYKGAAARQTTRRGGKSLQPVRPHRQTGEDAKSDRRIERCRQ